MNLNLKKRVALIEEFNKIQISNKDLMKIKKMQIEKRTEKMNFKKNQNNQPNNVLLEPIFNTELEAFMHYSKKYNVGEIKEYAAACIKYNNANLLANNEETNNIKTTYKEKINEIKKHIKNNKLNQPYQKMFNTELSDDTTLAKCCIEECADRWNQYLDAMRAALKRIPLVVSIDTGKSNTKYSYIAFNIETGTYGEVVTKCFESRVSRVTSLSTIGMSNILSVDDEKVIVSKEADKVCSSTNLNATGKTKAHDFHRFLKIEALRRVVDETGRDLFNVVIGCSLDSFKSDNGATVYLKMTKQEVSEEELVKMNDNGEKVPLTSTERKEFLQRRMNELMESFEPISYSIGFGVKDYTITINDLLICPETIASAIGFGGIDFDSEEFYNTYIIDIGGLNRTIVTYIAGALGPHHSNDQGMSYIINKASEFITSSSGDYLDEKIDHAYTERALKFYTLQDGNQPVDDYLYVYLDDLVNSLSQLEGAAFNPKTAKLMFVGGAAQSLKPFIEYYFNTEMNLTYPLEVAPDGLYSNVIGMYYFGTSKFEYRNKMRQENATVA